MKSRESDKGRQLTSWSLTRGKPEPSIEDYILNIDGTLKSDIFKNNNSTSSRLHPKKKLSGAAKPVSKGGVRGKRVNGHEDSTHLLEASKISTIHQVAEGDHRAGDAV